MGIDWESNVRPGEVSRVNKVGYDVQQLRSAP